MTIDHRDPETYAIIGTAMEVHRHLGPGFREAVYHAALCREFNSIGLPFESEVPLTVMYKGSPLEASYRADLVCFGTVVVELKAVRETGALEEGQLVNYLKASGCTRGLLLNFGGRSLTFKRCIYSRDDSNSRLPQFQSV